MSPSRLQYGWTKTVGPVVRWVAGRRRALAWRLFTGFVLVALGSSLIAGLGTALFWRQHVQTRQERELQRVADIVAHARFPLSRSVLQQMRELSGVEFVTASRSGQILDTTLSLDKRDEKLLSVILQHHAEDREPTRTVNLSGKQYRVRKIFVAYRTGSPNDVYAVLLLHEQAALVSEMAPILPATGVAAGCAVALSAIVSVWLARTIAKPLTDLARATVRAARDWDTSIPFPSTSNEVRDLAVAIQQMIRQRQEFERALREEERNHALHEMGRGLAHQLRNLVTALRLAVDLHVQSCHGTQADDELTVAYRQLQAIEVTLREFLTLTTQAPHPELIDLRALLDEVLELLQPAIEHAQVALRVEVSQDSDGQFPVKGHRWSLFQLMANLITNGFEAARQSSHQPQVWILLDRQDNTGQLVVRDNGPGVASQVQERLFKAPVTTKPDGIGLGLLVCQTVAAQHCGTLNWSREGEWTEFVFEFPLASNGNRSSEEVQA
ncbi:HAMP domain-containing sensor histidine kinase [Thermogutta sp.]|uniref:sensor histidine kinase n=1 Tax=Thermogutta sp. TaxID=1962930 RepID=UPI0032203674